MLLLLFAYHTAIKVGLSMREYTVPEGTNGTACLETFGQIQRSFNITFTIESLTNILRGRPDIQPRIDACMYMHKYMHINNKAYANVIVVALSQCYKCTLHTLLRNHL